MAMLGDVSVDALKKFDLLFLSSIPRCRVLRDGGYKGLIVLFSGELSYLDEHTLSLFDYKLPLPILEDSVARFSDWFLLQKINKKKTRVDNTSRADDATTTVSMSTIPNTSIKAKRQTAKSVDSRRKLVALQKLLNNFITGYIYIGSEKFQWNSVETYFKWRFLNPTKSVSFHNTQLIYLYSCLVLLRLLLMYIGKSLISVRLLLFDLFAIVPIGVYASKEYLYKYFLTPFKVKLATLLAIMSVLGVLMGQLKLYQPILSDCRVVEDSHYVPVGRPLNETLLACNSGGYATMHYILAATPLFSRWSTWSFPQ